MKFEFRERLGNADDNALLVGLRSKPINYEADELDRGGWHRDECRTRLPDERPGDPEPDGSFTLARRLIETYEAPVPSTVQGLYVAGSPLQGRDILLAARFHGLRLLMGVRITEVIDELRDDQQRAWGWTYETLQGHLERGRMTYEVVKQLDTGRVEFVIRATSQRAPTVDPLLRLGWSLFGRRTQLRFYQGCGERVCRLVTDIRAGRSSLPTPVVTDGLVRAPSDGRATDHKLTVRRNHPG